MKLDRNAIPISFAGQKQTGVSTHDGVYYVLASEPKSPQSGNIRFQFQMLNTIIRLKLYGLPAGTYTKLSLTTEEPLFVQDGTFSIDNMNITGKTFSNSLDMTLEDFTLTEAATEANPVFLYVTSAPVDFTGKKLTVQMYSADDRLFKCEKTPSKPCEAGTWYAYKCPMEESCVKYTKTSSISVGSTYLIVDANDQRLFKGAKDGSFMSITPENTVITDHDGSLAAYEFTVEKTAEKYYLKFNDGKYLVCNYNGNSTAGLAYVNSQAEVQYPYALTTGNNGAFFFSTTQVNSAANTDQVLYYKAEDKVFKIGGSGRTIGVHLYMKDGKLDRGLSFNPESVSCRAWVSMSRSTSSICSRISGPAFPRSFSSSRNFRSTLSRISFSRRAWAFRSIRSSHRCRSWASCVAVRFFRSTSSPAFSAKVRSVSSIRLNMSA